MKESLLAFIVIIDGNDESEKNVYQKEFNKFIFVLNIITLFIKTEKQQKEILDIGY